MPACIWRVKGADTSTLEQSLVLKIGFYINIWINFNINININIINNFTSAQDRLPHQSS